MNSEKWVKTSLIFCINNFTTGKNLNPPSQVWKHQIIKIKKLLPATHITWPLAEHSTSTTNCSLVTYFSEHSVSFTAVKQLLSSTLKVTVFSVKQMLYRI